MKSGWGLFGLLFGLSDELDTQRKAKANRNSLESRERIARWDSNMQALKALQEKNYSTETKMQNEQTSDGHNQTEQLSYSIQEIVLHAEALKNGNVKLWWNRQSSVSSYKVFRQSVGSGKFTQIALLNGNQRRFTDPNVQPETQYIYYVHAASYIDDEIDSNQQIVTTLKTEDIPKEATNPNPNKKATKKSPDFDHMDGHAFEDFCATLLKENGFRDVRVTRGSGDQGVDILAKKGQIKYGIQCKCYNSAVGNKAVQEVFSGKTYYNLHVGVVLTNNYFTPSAIDLAEKNGVLLWNRKELLSLIKKADIKNKENDIHETL